MKKNKYFKDYVNGQTIYVSTVFTVTGPTSNAGKRFEQSRNGTVDGKYGEGIYDAEYWANKSFFRGYYDRSIPFDSAAYPLKVQMKHEETKVTLKPDKEIKNPKLAEGWEAENATTKIKLDESIVGTDGKTYQLQCSYIVKPDDKTPVNCSSSGNEPYLVRGTATADLNRNPKMYIGGTNVVALYNQADCKCKQSATIPNKSKLEGKIPLEQSVIGKQIPVQVDLQQDSKEYENWKKWVKGKTGLQIRVRMWRNDQTDKITGLANTGDRAKWAATGKAPTPANDEKPELRVNVTEAQLLAYLNGNGSKLIYNDDLTNYPIPEGGKVSFRYNASVYIYAKEGNAELMKQCTGNPNSTEMTWFRPEPKPPLTGDFISTPKYWSEIKQGSPQTSGTGANETFDAMSGTPTTRSLYFASGGSEFMVDVQVEYVPKVTQTRSYRSYFTPVVNGWAMSSITGSPGHGSAPSRPTPRVMTDSAGQSYTEVVSQHSSKHVTKAAVPCSGNPCTGGSPEESHTDYWWVQEGYSSHMVGGYEDTWTQTVTFDYMKINKAVVWKLDRSKVNGMATLVGTNEVTATVTQGDPNIFYNIASSNTSAAGRLRYSLETDQHDTVVWNEGSSDNAIANSKVGPGPVKEDEKFKQRRALTTNVTAISDFLILQTSSGDQSVMYFEKPSNTAKVTDQLDVPTSDFDTMWTRNSLSAAKWNVLDTIQVGSYNGNFSNPSMKYSGGNSAKVATIFDSKPAGLNRPSQPGGYMRLMQAGLDIPDTLINGQQITGYSSVFYRTILNHNPKNKTVSYSTTADDEFGSAGQSFISTYSPLHSKINDIVIHNPVSVEDARVVSLDSHLDQRTSSSKDLGGNKQEPVVEFERVLDPDYRQNIIPNPDAEIVNVNKSVAGWNTWVASGNNADMRFISRGEWNGKDWIIGGESSFEVTSKASSGTTGGYWRDIPIKPNTSYKFEGDISCHRCEGYFSLNFYTAEMNVTGGAVGASDINRSSVVQHKSFTFTSPSNAAFIRIHMIKGKNMDAVSYANDHLFVDNLKLMNMSMQEFIAVDGVYMTTEIPNPDYRKGSDGTSEVFAHTGGVQTFKAPSTGVYTLELWGAQGGSAGGVNNAGGYAKGDITLTAGQILSIYVGGQGANGSTTIDQYDGCNRTGGFNGGGTGCGNAGAGGGGASDVRLGGERIIIAGGGGGDTTSSAGNQSYGGASKTTSTLWNGHNGDTGRHSSSYPNDEGGGGGGYYGGEVNHGDDTKWSYGGTSWTGSLSNATMTAGNSNMPSPSGATQIGQTGHGAIKITSPASAEVGSPNLIVEVLAGGSDTAIPSEAYKLVEKKQDPSAPVNGQPQASFILLDKEFFIDFPNTGDFYGNGQWGWSTTTGIRGKGFTDGMDTTEWTKAKYVRFDFHVIYDGTLYQSNEWISLPVNERNFRFYLPLANREKISALVEFKSIANNAPYEDNDAPTNRIREYNHAAKHSTLKKFNIDVVGRIGNMTIQDTGDFRFSNFFKTPLGGNPTPWYIPNVVRKVNPYSQNNWVGDTIDLRGEQVSSATKVLNTYGLLTHLNFDLNMKKPMTFPLSPEKNNIKALDKQPLRLGYNVLSDIQTIGNYYSSLQIMPYFYALNLQTGKIDPVDMYMKVGQQYKPINFSDKTKKAYSYSAKMDWDAEVKRRNVFGPEEVLTSRVTRLFLESGGDSIEGSAVSPYGVYSFGNTQLMQLTGRNRTFIGTDATYGQDKNPGNVLSSLEYGMQAQRWHYTYAIPSSAVAVAKDAAITQKNIDVYRKNNMVIILAADIKAVGDTYVLQYSVPGDKANGHVKISGTSWSLASIPHPVIAVYSANKTSGDDLQISGTH
ncbi:glycine rich domain-containing protein [Paenibacillus sp. GCM10027627]|uniref:glycine rich domain-containing protein n=1 Tax=unclassified Paenibacillus TaxID=185978 RepID=UPI0036265D2F